MHFLFCSEFYYPSIGGVQEVMRHIAERLVKLGHEVTVATSWLEERDFEIHNGVNIKEFSVAGNHVSGLVGDVQSFQEYLVNFSGDAILIKAAQQWTFDSTWDVLDKVKVRKVFIPCGFSGLYEPSFQDYFAKMPDILRKFDHLIFYAENYRDVNFARKHNINHFSIVPNGACEQEFEVPVDISFRQRYQIPEDAFLLLTVGSFTGMKGHLELVRAMSLLKTSGQNVVLLLNGNRPPKAAVKVEQVVRPVKLISKIPTFNKLYHSAIMVICRFSGLTLRSFGVLRREGFHGVASRFILLGNQYFPWFNKVLSKVSPRYHQKSLTIEELAIEINENSSNMKTVSIVDLPRAELVQAYMATDLFVFASNIEYSPLVLFESAAAGTPFLTVPVGNAEEIAEWTQGGIICPADKDERGYTRVEPSVLADEINVCMNKRDELQIIGAKAKRVWQEKYSWMKIAKRYEAILLNKENECERV